MRTLKSLPIILSVFLTACTLFSPSKVTPPNTYLLEKIPCDIVQAKSNGKIILVINPETRPVLNTTQMAYSTRPYKISYYSQNQWAETPPQMLQPLIVETLKRTHQFKAVVTPPYLGTYQYVLNTQVKQLLQDFTHRPPLLEFHMSAQIIDATTSKTKATTEIKIEKRILRKPPYGGVLAANEAVAEALSQLATFCVKNL